MNFRERVPFGGTGLKVCRLGLAQGYGLPAAGIERAVREHGINYLYLSPVLNMGAMVEAVRNLKPAARDDLLLVLARPLLRTLRLERYVERWLRKFELDRIDLLFQDVRKTPKPALFERVQALQAAGKVRFLGFSSHNREFLGSIARGETATQVDFVHVRYNAEHTGAERDLFPHVRAGERPGVTVFTATSWRKLLKEKKMPPGERPLTAAECYRFVLSHPGSDVVLTAPSSIERLDENLRLLDDGPLDAEELERARRIGAHLYG